MTFVTPPSSFDAAQASPAELKLYGVPAEPAKSSPEYPKWKAMIEGGIHFVAPPQQLVEAPGASAGASAGPMQSNLLQGSGELETGSSPVWGGYLNDVPIGSNESAYTKVTGYFKQPEAAGPECGEEPASATWVGLGGWHTQILAQAGTVENWFFEKKLHKNEGFVEILPQEEDFLHFTASPNYYMEAETQYLGEGDYHFYLYNYKTHDAIAPKGSVSEGEYDGETADYIVEREFGHNLFNFGKFPFQAFTNGTAFQKSPTERLDMENKKGENVRVSNILNKYEFTDTFKNCERADEQEEQEYDRLYKREKAGSGYPAPKVATGQSSEVTAASAKLNGTVNPEGDYTVYHFEYGTEADNFEASSATQAAGEGTTTGPVSATASGLRPGTTYYYRLSAESGNGIRNGEELTFKTAGTPPPPPPTVTTEGGTGIGVHKATVDASVDPNGADTHYYFEYGTSPGLYEQAAPAAPGTDDGSATTANTVSVALSGLSGYTTYYYRVLASSSSGTSYGGEREFKTNSAWALQSTPEVNNPGETSGVSCSSAEACTSVGSYSPPAKKGQAIDTLAERWNGSTWAVQTTPNDESAEQSQLRAVSCPSEKACIAVGSYHVKAADKEFGVFAESWNGKTWTYEKLPLPEGATEGASELSQIYGISCSSSTACTAVGEYKAEKAWYALVERWNGKTWQAERTPMPSGEETPASEYLTGISCPAAKECIATGSYSREETGGGSFGVALAEQWNGKTWTIIANPFSGEFSSSFSHVACVSSTSCTAIGGYSESREEAIDGPSKLVSERWNGSAWEDQQPIPTPNGSEISLPGMSCSSTSCTIVGSYRPAGTEGDITMDRGLTIWWNGTAWELEAPPVPAGAIDEHLHGVSCTSATVCTAVGQYNSSTTAFTLAERSQFDQE
jgi:hypothetical protein